MIDDQKNELLENLTQLGAVVHDIEISLRGEFVVTMQPPPNMTAEEALKEAYNA